MAIPFGICPRCGGPFQEIDLKGVSVLSCTKCRGTQLEQGQLPRVLAAMSAEIVGRFDPEAKLSPVPDRGGGVACAACNRPMTNDDYCGARLVSFDRCEPCGLLWLDVDELGTMSLMWARMNARSFRDHGDGERRLSETQSFVDGVLLSQAVSSILFGGAGGVIIYDDDLF